MYLIALLLVFCYLNPHKSKCYLLLLEAAWQHVFFQESSPFGTLINRLHNFRIRLRFRRPIQTFIFDTLSGVIHTMQSPIPQWEWQRRVKKTTLLKWTLISHSHHGVKIENSAGLRLLLKEQSGRILVHMSRPNHHGCTDLKYKKGGSLRLNFDSIVSLRIVITF